MSWRGVGAALSLVLLGAGCVGTGTSTDRSSGETAPLYRVEEYDGVTRPAIGTLDVAFGATQIVVRYRELIVLDGSVEAIVCATSAVSQKLDIEREPMTGQLLDMSFVLDRRGELSVTCTAANPLGDHVVTVDTDFVRTGGVQDEDCSSGWVDRLLPQNLECRMLARSAFGATNLEAAVKFESPTELALGAWESG